MKLQFLKPHCSFDEDCVAEAQEELAATDADSAEDDCEVGIFRVI